MPITRVPTQKRSIEKRNRIVEKGFELMCENGYHNTTTQDIASYAGVSTGIIYQYFNDKKEIFIEGVKNYAGSIMFPMLNILENKKIDLNNLEELIKSMIKKFIDKHNLTKKAHEELMAMVHLDDDIRDAYKEYELESNNKIIQILKDNGINIDNPKETVHIIMGIIDNLCHDIVYHNHDDIDYDIMINEAVNIITKILK